MSRVPPAVNAPLSTERGILALSGTLHGGLYPDLERQGLVEPLNAGG